MFSSAALPLQSLRNPAGIPPAGRAQVTRPATQRSHLLQVLVGPFDLQGDGYVLAAPTASEQAMGSVEATSSPSEALATQRPFLSLVSIRDHGVPSMSLFTTPPWISQANVWRWEQRGALSRDRLGRQPVILLPTALDHLQRSARQRPLKRLGLLPGGRHPDLDLLRQR